MPVEVTMAKLSPTMESGQLVKWNVKVGDPVKEGDVLAEIQTDKAVMPMEAFDDGTVALLDVAEGDEVALGQRVLVLAKKGEDPAQVAEQLKEGDAKAGGAAGPVQEAVAAGAPTAAGSAYGHSTAANGQQAGDASSSAPGGRIRSSPLARKIAERAGVDLGQIPGSGPNGRIIRRDVEAFLRDRSAAPASAPTAAPAPSMPMPVATGPVRQTQRVPHSRMRKTIAQRMLQAKQSAPEIHVTADIRMDRVVALREQLNAQLAKQKIKLSVSDFVTKAVAMALRQHPGLNATYEAEEMVLHGQINIGIAVALEGGLIVPVLPDADRLGLVEIRQGTLALTEAARSNTLTPKQMMGSTFTISNLGMYGVKQFDAILNLPEVGILAVGSIEARPVVENGQLVAGQVMTVTLTADHRAVDGAMAAEFVRTLKGFLEEPASMLL
ncbi:dihydrolipoamide acetyltransferase family protein [Tautonia sociabilis]|uniref:Dihydrolipoamide acetyltransferase component of pyruvate dehydrogenase complex n=1 Tax=Tautonia sociabilis TaxID=2080755 RepID=A0A432MJH3_9BACT|nr:dihydrolipoamide acetyltransferase family protein [Tautonia sociabilis]RUL87553.1 2-oxo acid dehydrogenase subunit E2 [Tautonia sociabilis]